MGVSVTTTVALLTQGQQELCASCCAGSMGLLRCGWPREVNLRVDTWVCVCVCVVCSCLLEAPARLGNVRCGLVDVGGDQPGCRALPGVAAVKSRVPYPVWGMWTPPVFVWWRARKRDGVCGVLGQGRQWQGSGLCRAEEVLHKVLLVCAAWC